MKYIQGQNREQAFLFPVCLDEAVKADNEVRLIDVFVDGLQLEEFGFRVDHIENGRPAYHPADLLKLYIYGYLNQMRSSRRLEKECRRNIEVRWLLRELQPDHNTIANFRRDNPKIIKKVFREYLDRLISCFLSKSAVYKLIKDLLRLLFSNAIRKPVPFFKTP